MLRTIDEALNYIEQQKVERKIRLESLNVYVCVGTGCAAKGSLKVFSALKELFEKNNINAKLQKLEED